MFRRYIPPARPGRGRAYTPTWVIGNVLMLLIIIALVVWALMAWVL